MPPGFNFIAGFMNGSFRVQFNLLYQITTDSFKSKLPETRVFKGTCYTTKSLLLMGETIQKNLILERLFKLKYYPLPFESFELLFYYFRCYICTYIIY